MARFAPQASLVLSFALLSLVFSVLAYPSIPAPTPFATRARQEDTKRADQPTFPSDVPSCPICEQSYPSIDSCAQAAPVLENFTMVSSPVPWALSGGWRRWESK